MTRYISFAAALLASTSVLAQTAVTVTAPDAPTAMKILQGQLSALAAGSSTIPARTTVSVTAKDFASAMLILQGKAAPATTTATPALTTPPTPAPTTTTPATTTTAPPATTPPATTPATTPSATAAADPNFPSDPTIAPFPSPENSSSTWFAGKAGGSAYLRDGTGTIWQLITNPNAAQVSANPTTQNGAVIALNGVARAQPDYWAPAQLLVRQGAVWAKITSGQWQYFNPSTGSFYNGTLPAAWTDAQTKEVAATGLPPMPALPTKAAVAPGSSGTTLKVGQGQQYATVQAALDAAKAGDTVSVALGTYYESPNWPAATVKLAGTKNADGTPGTVFDCSAAKVPQLSHQLGCLVPVADAEIDDVAITGAGMTESQGGGTAGVRAGGDINLLLNNVYAYANQNGFFSGGYKVAWVINNSRLEKNGLAKNAGSATHNAYFSGPTVSVTLNNLTSIDPVEAHAIKSRANVTTIKGGFFRAIHGSCWDFPDGSTQVNTIDGATCEKPADADDHKFMTYGVESQSNGLAGITVTNSTFNLPFESPFIAAVGGKITFDATDKWTGNKPTIQGTTATGLPQ